MGLPKFDERRFTEAAFVALDRALIGTRILGRNIGEHHLGPHCAHGGGSMVCGGLRVNWNCGSVPPVVGGSVIGLKIGSCKMENGQFYTDSHLVRGARPPQ
jgi:hypothetical protein